MLLRLAAGSKLDPLRTNVSEIGERGGKEMQ